MNSPAGVLPMIWINAAPDVVATLPIKTMSDTNENRFNAKARNAPEGWN